MRYRILLILFIISLGSYAQDGHRWETVLGQVMTAEDMADEGWQQNYEMLCELEQNPININRTTREELEALPFLSAQQVEAIMEYMYRYGSMKSMAELICHGPVPWQPVDNMHGAFGLVDDLYMSYEGNLLTSVRDNSTHSIYASATDFYTDSNKKEYPLTYNGAGSLVSDAGRKIAKIDYDLNNNPVRIQFTNGNECEIFLVEGDSAGGSAKQGRDRHFQAILPLRGKILNVEKVQWHRVFEAESVMNIIQSIGVRFGVDGEDSKDANIDKLRYDKIIIMTDADVDGSHIDTLIMTLFYRFMPQVIQGGHLYIATPPLYKCTYKKTSEYCYTEQQRQAFIDKYVAGNGDDKALHTQRYKGLGEMNPEQLWETTMNPENRLLKQVTIENAAEADEIFSMLMGDDVEPRREFIEKNATYANIDA